MGSNPTVGMSSIEIFSIQERHFDGFPLLKISRVYSSPDKIKLLSTCCPVYICYLSFVWNKQHIDLLPTGAVMCCLYTKLCGYMNNNNFQLSVVDNQREYLLNCA